MTIKDFDFELTIQTFDDSPKKDSKKAKIFHYDRNEISKVVKQGCGVFWAINPQKDLTKRSIENVKEFRVVGLDCDVAKEGQDVDRETLKIELFDKLVNLALPPSGIIETKNGLQPYWYFKKAREIKNLLKAGEDYLLLIESFTKHTGIKSEGDNLARVLRFPGTYHQKNPKDKFKIKEIYSEGKPTTFEKFLEVYPLIKTHPRGISEPADFERIASIHGWSIVKNLTEGESCYWKGKEYDGRNDLLKSVFLSVYNFQDKYKYDPEEVCRWLNSLMSSPLPGRELQGLMRHKERFAQNHPLETEKTFEPTDSLFKVSDDDVFESEDSGFQGIDDIVQGFRYGNTYLVGGVDKSGKSSFLIQIADYLLKQGKKIAYLNTELKDVEFRVAMTAVSFDKVKTEVEKNLELQKQWTEKYQEKISYMGVADLTNKQTHTPNFDNLITGASHFIKKGVRIFFFDNLSTFANQSSNRSTWEVLSSCGSKIVNFAKTNNALCFVVIHAKNDVVFSETPQAIRKYIEENESEKIFDESISVVRRLTSNDIHGGSVLRSQLSGTILIWRPFQNFEKSERLPRETAILLESFRHARSGSSIRMEFGGAKGQFTEDPLAGVMENLKTKGG